ncbi:DUF2505 domain-containing protein [Mycobacterium shigaense]|uniref:Uncharacterized protein n=1 Tax=Mycobacterium shigaense TaxID=722731 RepID=A0A1Z4ED40_9MYCO|nr:DUF2505 domain-containing protein [Mycobacterium shigaense]MEA1122273.1 DUF2505 domain-containing protein [Mycobacterium shigaense]PRI16951.1 hypothetical protein B2J96_00285 [Mycobacterium shigaense]BAX90863.1 hypothetical protein MSG_00699 [Mycobacterium shigaense]
MPRSFDLSAEYQDSVEEVLQAFTDEAYWLARLAASGVDDAKLELLEPGDNGALEVVTLQIVHSDKLPGMISQLHRGDLCIRREESWGPVTDGTASSTFSGSVAGAPAKVSGTATLFPAAESGGSRLECQLTVHVRIPLIGGKLEKIIGTELANLVSAEQQFTSEWIISHG